MLNDFAKTPSFKGASLKELTVAYIYLIPKVKNANNLIDFRPISMCITTYKVITKIISQCLRTLMETIIGPCQSSFLKNRQATNNFIIIQEIITQFKKNERIKGKYDPKNSFRKSLR